MIAEPTSPAFHAASCSALDDALALIALGPQRSANSLEWYRVSLEMCEHCQGSENVVEASARIVTAEYRKAMAVIEAIEERYIDGCDTYKDWKFMGDTARAFLEPNV